MDEQKPHALGVGSNALLGAALGNVVAGYREGDSERCARGLVAAIDVLRKAEADIASLQATARPRWQPIETAPRRSYPPVLVYAPAYDGLPELMIAMNYDHVYGWTCDQIRSATHWMPLPLPPNAGHKPRGEAESA